VCCHIVGADAPFPAVEFAVVLGIEKDQPDLVTELVPVEDAGQLAKIKEVWADLPHLKHAITMMGADADADPRVLSWEAFLAKGEGVDAAAVHSIVDKIDPDPVVTIDWDATWHSYERLCDLYGDILRVGKRGRSFFWFAPMDMFITWRGIEQMFVDLMRQCSPRHLTAYGRFTRRGGIDINPFRSNSELPLPNRRTIRQ